MMKMIEAMYKRHTVRKYLDKNLPDSFIDVINERIEENNQKLLLNMKLIIKDSFAIPVLFRLFMCKGVKNYIILCGNHAKDLEERIGYAACDLMLFAQTLGLNTWFVSGTYNKFHVSKKVKKSQVLGILVIGFGANDGRPHKEKRTPLEVSSYMGNDAPEWFNNGVEATLYAPTALNRQEYKIVGNGNMVKIDMDDGMYRGMDKGIIKYHFELGAGKENFEWEK